MNRLLSAIYPAAFIAGLAAIAWAGFAAVAHQTLALLMTLLIAAFYALGAWELRRFRQASLLLDGALSGLQSPPADLEAWLLSLPALLRDAVRQRLDGLRAALPVPVLAPTLAGLLVLLGMLGTFAGLVHTLGGTAAALRATADLAAMRGALTAPVQGLGLAFGTSVAGVAASAMLGLMAALARRERLAVSQRLDQALVSSLRPHTAAQRRELAQQALPAMLGQLQALAAQMAAQQQQFQAQWLAEQTRFHAQTREVYGDLAETVGRSLRDSLSASSRMAGDSIRPAVEGTMSAIAREAAALHEGVALQVSAQLDAVRDRFHAATEQLLSGCQQSLTAQAALASQQSAQTQQALAAAVAQTEALLQASALQTRGAMESVEQRSRLAVEGLVERVAQHSGALMQSLAETQSRQQIALAEGDAERLQRWQAQLETMAARLREDWSAAAAQDLLRQQQLSDRVASTAQGLVEQAQLQAQATITEAGALLQAAAEAPRAAAEVVAAMRQQLSQSLAQDNAALAERTQLMQTLHTLLDSVQRAAGEQRQAIDALLGTSAEMLEGVSQRFAAQAEGTTTTLADAAIQLAGSAAEMGSLGEGFGQAVERFNDSNERLITHLVKLDGSLENSMNRSDEQLGYYVAQARELIDLCLMSQKQVLDGLRGVAGQQPLPETSHG